MAYSDSFNFGTGPSLETRVGYNSGGQWQLPGYTTYDAINPGQQDEKAAADLNRKMAAHDAASASYTKKLKALYEDYNKYATTYGDQAQSINDALAGDIEGLQGYIGDYKNTLNDIKSNMMDGVNLDPSATNTREIYQGNVAAQFGKAREKQKQEALSQGLNPYSNTGANRANSLAEAASLADAGNKAYTDWRSQYNNDVQAKQRGQSQFATLQAGLGTMHNGVMSGRGMMLNTDKSIFDAKMKANEFKATGYEGLSSLQEARRSETLGFAQQKQNNAQTYNDLMQQTKAKQDPLSARYQASGGSI